MTREINKTDYLRTMTAGMIDVTSRAEAVVDIWPYVEELVQQKRVLPYVLQKQLVQKVYRTSDNNYEHIILPTDEKNFHIVLIIDRNQKAIMGHHLLDLTKEYS